MTKQEIRDLYDLNPNMILSQLSKLTGKSVTKLKAILMAHAS